jgi:hypothetical protein
MLASLHEDLYLLAPLLVYGLLAAVDVPPRNHWTFTRGRNRGGLSGLQASRWKGTTARDTLSTFFLFRGDSLWVSSDKSIEVEVLKCSFPRICEMEKFLMIKALISWVFVVILFWFFFLNRVCHIVKSRKSNSRLLSVWDSFLTAYSAFFLKIVAYIIMNKIN